MKPLWRHILGALTIALFLAVWIISSGMATSRRRGKTCQGIKVEISDSLERRFVAKEDVREWMQDYGVYMGLPLDSVRLDRIETIMDSRSAVRKSQAWLTEDGYIHIALTQREPVIRFQDGDNGFYADASGFIFPLQSRFCVRVPIVDGELPLKVARGFKGDRSDDKWLMQMLGMAAWMESSPWDGIISQISVNADGDIVLIPREGRERFIFGSPDRIEDKLRLVRRYYEAIKPNTEKGKYAWVDVRQKGQIVCR